MSRCPLYALVKRAFALDSKYWLEHFYEQPSTGYFSYLQPLCDNVNAPPQNVGKSAEQRRRHAIVALAEQLQHIIAKHIPAVKCVRCSCSAWLLPYFNRALCLRIHNQLRQCGRSAGVVEWWAQHKPHHAGLSWPDCISRHSRNST